MNHEFTPLDDTKELWNAAIAELRVTEEGRRPRILGQLITTVPPETKEPEQITLHYDYDGAWHDVYRTLTITSNGPLSFRYQNLHWGAGAEAVDLNDEDYTYGPDDEATLHWISTLIKNLRFQKEQDSQRQE